MVAHVMVGPQPWQSGHRDKDPPARLQLPRQGAERGHVLFDMLQHVEEENHVVARRQQVDVLRQRAGANVHLGLAPSPIARLGVALARLDPAEALQQRQVSAGTAADLQQRQIVLCRFYVRDQARKDRATGDEPPVLVFVCGHSRVDCPIHGVPQSSSAWPSPNDCLTT